MFWLRIHVRVAVERGPATWALAAAELRRGPEVPLVEELDREIEVLDAGLPGAFGEVADAAALQLAWAVATRRG